MKTRLLITTVAFCALAAIVLPPLTYGQTSAPVVRITAELSGNPNDLTSLLGCKEDLQRVGASANLGSSRPVSNLTLVKRLDSRSSDIRKRLAGGQYFPVVRVHFGLYNGDNGNYIGPVLDLSLYDVTVTGVVLEVQDGAAVEELKLQFARGCWKSATPTGSEVNCWDFSANRPIPPPPDVQ